MDSHISYEYFLDIETPGSYPGNFERELAAFVFGFCDQYSEREYSEMSALWTEDEQAAILFWHDEDEDRGIVLPQENEYGVVWESLADNGCIRIQLEDWSEVGPRELDSLKARLERFRQIHNSQVDAKGYGDVIAKINLHLITRRVETTRVAL